MKLTHRWFSKCSMAVFTIGIAGLMLQIGISRDAIADDADANAASKGWEEWPRWRGPRGDGTWKGPQIADSLPNDGLKTVWTKEIGGGYAGVSVSDGRVIVLDRQAEPSEVERILCFDAGASEELWKYEYAVEYGELSYGNGPRAAATIAGGRVYCTGALGHVHCLELETGKVLWKLHLQEDLGGRLDTWGYSASPLLLKEQLILQPGGEDGTSVVSVDPKSGKVVWQSQSDQAGYATPVLIERNGREQLICWTPSHVRSLDPQSGELNWAFPYEVTYGVSIATPVYHRGIVFVSGYWEGSKAIELGEKPTDAVMKYEDERWLRGLMSQPLVKGDYGYLLDKTYGLTCFEFATGEKLWDDGNRMTPRGRNPQASLVWVNDDSRVLVLNSDGDLISAKLSPQGYDEEWRTKIIGETWAHPAYAGKRVYARSDTELVCVELPVAAE